MSRSQQLLKKGHLLPLALVAVYALILLLLTVPWVQREMTFLHWLRYPFFPKYDNPEAYGLAPFKTRNLRIDTPDGEQLGAWHVLCPHSYYAAMTPFPPHIALDGNDFDKAFAVRPTVIYYHGNAATRVQAHRIRGYIEMSRSMDCNVVAVDYRGFADSSGSPTEQGLVIDARATYDWVASKIKAGGGDVEKNIILVGHSLGTGVVSSLSAELAAEKKHPRAIILIAPFSSIPELLSSLWLFGIIPLLTPLAPFPRVQGYFKTHLAVRFNSTEALTHTSSPTLLIHSASDNVVPHSHSSALYQSLISPGSLSDDEVISFKGWGTVRHQTQKGRPVVWWEGPFGGHNHLGWTEGTIDLMAWVANVHGVSRSIPR